MAITTIYTYPLNGTQRDFTIPFEYLARRFVAVTLIGANRRELTLTADFRFLSKTLVQMNVAWGPADGYERIEIRRNTSATDRLVDFADGSILRAAELNTSQVQTLHVAEEARNMVADTISENADGDLDARGRRLVNLADALSPDHAVTLRQEQEWAASTLGSKNAAEAAKDRAVIAQNISETRAGEAMVSAASAEGSETNAKTSENNSKVSETNAKTSENNSKVSETNAASSAESALASKAAAALSAATVALPPAAGKSLQILRQGADEAGLEYVPLDILMRQSIHAEITAAAYTFLLADAYQYIAGNSTKPQVFTVPVGFTVGHQLHVRQRGLGQITITPASGVTIDTAETLKLRKKGSTATMLKVSESTWEIFGDLELA